MPETTAYRSPLTVQFVDSVTGVAVADSLAVCTWPRGDPSGTVLARPSPISANLGFGLLPGFGPADEALAADPETFAWSPPGPGRPFEMRGLDTARRYLPELVAVSVPQGNLATFPLFSAPNRPPPSGCATVVGEVQVAGTATATALAAPAAWALVQVASGPDTYTTMADQMGRYLVYLPYPEALPPLNPSPPPGPASGVPTWPVSVSASYQPSAQQVLADADATDPPELGSLLGQAAAAISAGGGTQPSLTATLSFGAPLLLMLEVVPA